jgi:hypothetical protein
VHFLARVLVSGTDAPVADAEILLFDSEYGGKSWPLTQEVPIFEELGRVRTDADGFLDVWAPSWKDSAVRVTSPGLSRAYLVVEPGHDTPETAVVVHLDRGASLFATVEQDGEPVRDITIWLSSKPNDAIGFDAVQWKRTGIDGSCRMEGLPANVPLFVRLERPSPPPPTPFVLGWSYPEQRPWQTIPETLTLRPGEMREQSFILKRLCSMQGVVRETDGRPVAGITLGLIRGDDEWIGERRMPCRDEFGEFLQTDAEGRFVVDDLPSDVWRIGPVVDGWREGDDLLLPAGPLTRVNLVEGADPTRLEIVVHRGLFIEGVVVGPKGEEVASSMVSALEFEPVVVGNSQGRFRFGPLVPGEYHLYADGWCADGKRHLTNEGVVAHPGDRGVRLELAARSADEPSSGDE